MDVLVCGVGTGGTVTGISRYLKNTQGKAVHVVAVEPSSTTVITAAKACQEAAPDDASPGRLIQDLLREEGLTKDLATSVPDGVSPGVKSLLTVRGRQSSTVAPW